ncbi:MAG: hypothetical protein ABMA64_14630 [Myxococcota bacterium]
MTRSPPRCSRSRLFAALFAALFGLLLSASSPAAWAQGVAGFLSPGPLAAPHAELDSITQCTKCHQAGKGVVAARCLDCHDEIRAQVTTGRGTHADRGDTCLPCHLDHRGRDYQMVKFVEEAFDHGTTGFELRGGHAALDCAECHTSGEWGGLEPACVACHSDPHGGEQSTRALTAGCESCHTDQSWEALPLRSTVFDHDLPAHAAFALDGEHGEVGCEKCHDQWLFVPTPHEACTSCHQDPHRAPLSNDCASCHQVRADWRVPTFDHARTGFELEGVHVDVACKACHPRGVTKPVKHATCGDCHADPHRGQFAPRTCDACHSVTRPGFALADFDHSAVGWPLEGAHAEATCASCHGEGPEASYVAVSRACATCHDDAHAGRFAPDGCDACHTPTGWGVERFDHARTDYPLTGAHTSVDCAECHAPHQWAGVPHAQCTDCHVERPHDETVTADQCGDCHTTAAFAPITGFDHASTSFALSARHLEAACADCHGPARFVGLEPACDGCHLPDRPTPHFEGPCERCHLDAAWTPASLGPDGHAATGFPLLGSHGRAPCAGCHRPGLPTSAVGTWCVDCHATDDVHRNLLGDTCGDCHTETAWVATRWRHQRTGWPLHGAHRLAACDDCHAAGYVGTPTDCAQCHLGEAPSGIAAHQIPSFRDCGGCHKPYTWATPGFPH